VNSARPFGSAYETLCAVKIVGINNFALSFAPNSGHEYAFA